MLSYFFSVCSFIVENSFVCGTAVAVMYYLFFKRYEKRQARTDSNSTASTVWCGNKNCVRCTLYGDVLIRAKDRLLQSTANNTETENIRKTAERVLESISLTESLDTNQTNPEEQHPNVFHFRHLDSSPWWDKNDIADVSRLETAFQVVLEEFTDVYQSEHESLWKRNVTPTGSWDVFQLINQGTWLDENALLCPRTSQVIRSMPSVMAGNVFGNVMFSVLKPGTVITEHYGPTNIRLRCHLGLITSPAWRLTVGGVTSTWQTGQCLLFDDSFLHSVGHTEMAANILDYRAVLIVDVWHPDISKQERTVLNNAFDPS